MPTKSVLVRACPCPNKSASLDCQAAGMMDRLRRVRPVSYIFSDRIPIPPVMVPMTVNCFLAFFCFFAGCGLRPAGETRAIRERLYLVLLYDEWHC